MTPNPHNPNGPTMAPTFPLVDANGNLVAIIAVDEQGPMAGLCKPDGKVFARVALHNGESTVTVFDERERVRLQVRLDHAGTPFVSVFDEFSRLTTHVMCGGFEHSE